MIVKRIRSGAYVADPLTGTEINRAHFQLLQEDPGIQIEPTDEGLRVHGVSTKAKRVFSGICSRNLSPHDAVLCCEIKVCSDLSPYSNLGTVIHLCSRLIGREAHIDEIPDNNCEVTFGNMNGRIGWYRWYYDQTGGVFYKWKEEEEPLQPIGNESDYFRTARVTYSAAQRQAFSEILHEEKWIRVGHPVPLRKLFSSIELKLDVPDKGIQVESFFRNCRLYPNPERTGIEVYVGYGRMGYNIANAKVELLAPGSTEVLAKGMTNADGDAVLTLDPDWNYPIGGKIRVFYRSKTKESQVIPADGCEGIYPGDFYAVNPEGRAAMKSCTD